MAGTSPAMTTNEWDNMLKCLAIDEKSTNALRKAE
jgi:hypothetical protein